MLGRAKCTIIATDFAHKQTPAVFPIIFGPHLHSRNFGTKKRETETASHGTYTGEKTCTVLDRDWRQL